MTSRPLHVGVALPNYGPLAAPDILLALGRQAEALGFDSIWVSDHLVAPVAVRSIYPYDRRPDPKPGDLGVIERVFEPLTTLAWLAGQTTRVRLGVSAYVVPYRNPVVTAKHVATLDALSGGRVILGVGTGWLREEFDALAVPFAGRGRRTDEYLAVCAALWAGGEARFEGQCYQLPAVRSGPSPTQRPHPPLWVAGNSDAAIERAARLGDGWHAIDLTPTALAPRVTALRERVRAHARSPDAIAVSLRTYGRPAAIAANVPAWREAGLDALVVTLPRADSAQALDGALTDIATLLR